MAYFRKRGCKCKDKKKCTCGAKWSFTIDIGVDPTTGKRKQKTVSGFNKKKEAELAAAQLQHELDNGTYVEEKKVLFKDFAEEWLKNYSKSVKISTVRVRQHEINRLNDYLAHVELRKITRNMYQKALDGLYERGFSYNSISGAHTTAGMIFKKAIAYEIIRNNPAEFAKVPRKIETVDEVEGKKQEIKFLEKEELALFLKTAKEKGLYQDYVIFSLLAYSGMRAGELLALKWKDINFDENTISITKTLYNPKNRTTEYTLLTPKTKGSIRTLKMDPAVMDLLKKHEVKQKELKMANRQEFYDKDFVITKTSGYPEMVKTVDNRIRRLLKLAEIKKELTPHSLRHTHTSLLIEAGVGIKEIQQRLGHGDIETTMNIYAHMTKNMEEKASQKFSELMKDLL